jgi:hypothetical protein
MKKLRNVLIILVVLSILYGQREIIIPLFENEEEYVIKDEVINTSDDTSKAKDVATWKELEGNYRVVYYDEPESTDEFYNLDRDGSCAWSFMGSYKSGNYRVTKDGVLTITVQGNSGLITEVFARNEFGRWSKGNGYLSKVIK